MTKLQLLPARLDIAVFLGATLPVTLTLTQADGTSAGNPTDLTGYSGELEIYQVDGDVVFDSLTTGNGRLTFGGVAGTVSFILTPGQMGAYQFRKAAWSLEVTDPAGNVSALLAGDFQLLTEAPRV
jgi:hypothetical protein